MKSVIAYTRQSAARAHETRDTSLSLAAQEVQIRRWADEHELPVRAVCRDHDLKGDNPNRPDLQQALDLLEPGDTLVVYDLSRLARDNILQEQIYREIVARDAKLASVTEPHAEDDLFRGLMGVINQQFRRQLGKRIASNVEQKARRGQFHSRPPFGYSKQNGQLIPNEYAPIVREVFEMVAQGKAYHAIAREMHDRLGGNQFYRWDHRNINNMIHRWTYSGAVPHHDEVIWCDGGPCHPPIVSRELQERAIEMAKERSYIHVRRKEILSPLEGMVIHECGARAYLRAHGKDYESNRHTAFNCNRISTPPICPLPRKQISSRKLELYAIELLQRDLAGIPELADDAVALAQDQYEAQLPDTNLRRKALISRKSELVKRNERTVLLYQDGVRDRAWMLSEVQRIDDEMAQIDAELAHLPAPIEPGLVAQMAETVAPLKAFLHTLSIEQAAQLLETLGEIQFGPSGVTIRYREPYSYLIPHPAVLEWTTENPHLRKRDRAQATFKNPPEREAAEKKRKDAQKTGKSGAAAG